MSQGNQPIREIPVIRETTQARPLRRVATATAGGDRRGRSLKAAMLAATAAWDMAILSVPIASLIVLMNRLAAIKTATGDSPGGHAAAGSVPVDLWVLFLGVGTAWCAYWWALLTFGYLVVMVTLIVLYHCR